jgi:hypothetical protein
MSISNFGANGIRPGVCTSTTRPTTPYDGQTIYETDTDRILTWNGSSWAGISSTSLTSQNGLVVDTNTLVVDSINNRVGIGTASPTTQLEVYNAGGVGETTMTGGNGYGGVVNLKSTGGQFWHISGPRTPENNVLNFYYYNGSTYNLTLSGTPEGYVATPKMPAFRAWCGYVDGHAAITGGVFTATNVTLNNASGFRTSGTGAYQNFYAPVSGYYHFDFHWGIIGSTAGYYYGAYFQVDGSTPDGGYISYYKSVGGNDDQSSISTNLYLNANQYVRVAINNQISARFQFARFSGVFLG